MAKRYGRYGRGSDGQAIAKIGRELSGGVVVWHGVAVWERHGLWDIGVDCDSVNNKNRILTGRNGPKNGYAKNTVLDDVGSGLKWGYEVLWGVRDYRCCPSKMTHNP